MKWSESSGGHDFAQAPTGAQVARCVKLIDIGTKESTWEGKTNYKRQVVVMWELPNCLMTDGEYAGKPFIVSKFYTASLSEKSNLRHDLEAWRGKAMTPDELAGFDAKNILGKPCMLGITEGKNGKSRVTTVMQLPAGMTAAKQINPTVYFSLDEFNQEVFDSLSKGIKAMIEKSPEYQAIGQKGNGFEDLADDLPWDNESVNKQDEETLPF